jgi:hypothetical protein
MSSAIIYDQQILIWSKEHMWQCNAGREEQ